MNDSKGCTGLRGESSQRRRTVLRTLRQRETGRPRLVGQTGRLNSRYFQFYSRYEVQYRTGRNVRFPTGIAKPLFFFFLLTNYLNE